MGARNFYSANPVAVYAIETEDDAETEFLIESTDANIISELQALKLDTRELDAISSDNDRNYGGWAFGMVYGTNYANGDYAIVELIRRTGYYSGVNYDYVVSYMVEGEEYSDEELEGAAVLGKEDYKDITKTEVKQLRANARKLEKLVNKVLAANTTSLRTVGTFSNGEAVYEKV